MNVQTCLSKGVIALAVVLLVGVTPTEASFPEYSRRGPRGAISRGVTLNGCRADDVRLLLQAQPLAQDEHVVDGGKREREREPDWDSGEHRRRVVGAEQIGAQSFVFRFDGLRDGDPSKLLRTAGGRG